MIQNALRDALREALAASGLPEPEAGIVLDVPKQRDHGDWSSPVALALARVVGRPPREIAAQLQAALEAAGVPHLARVEIAGPGHLNFFLAPSWLTDVLRAVVDEGERFGTSDALAGARASTSSSSRPTRPDPCTRAAVAGWRSGTRSRTSSRPRAPRSTGSTTSTTRARSSGSSGTHSSPRYEGREPPEDGYQGQYLADMATLLHAELGDDVDADTACEWGYRQIVAGLQEDLGRIGVHFDTWFSERTLHERGDVEVVLRDLDARGVTFEADGAKWFRATDFGDQRDRVLIRSDGATTYLCNDYAYHRDKFARGYTHLIDIWGADHHGQVKSLQAGLEALGYPAGEPEIMLGQFVKLLQNGREVRISKRTGNIIALADILDEVDPDVARMVFLLQGIDSPQTFDLDVVTAQSMDNPVYYVQYAHARIASIGRRADAAGVQRQPLASVDLLLLTHEREEELLRALALYPQVVADAAETRAPQKVTTWVRDFARAFHGFYRDCRVLTEDAALTQARLWLTEACRVGLANALGILGVHAPDEMARLDDDTDPDPNA